MPNISLYLLRRFGISVFLFYQDADRHSAPHLHVRYQEHKASYRIPDGERLAGRLPAKVERRLRAWISMNEDELQDRWDRAVRGRPITKID